MKKQKGFTLIELIVVMSIIGVLALIGVPKYKEYIKDARLTKITVQIKELEKASQKYYMRYDEWPRLSDEPYTSEELMTFTEKIYDKTGVVVILEEDGSYYDIDYAAINNYIKEPKDKINYILQNPVGNVYFLENLTEEGIKTLNESREITPERETGPLVTWDTSKFGGTIGGTADAEIAIIKGLNGSGRAETINGKTSGKWYWEVTLESGYGINLLIGASEYNGDVYLGQKSYYSYSGYAYNKYETPQQAYKVYGQPYPIGSTISILMNLDDGTIEFWRNGVSQGVALSDLKDNRYHPSITTGTTYSMSITTRTNFGAREFKYEVPEGYKPYDYANALWFD